MTLEKIKVLGKGAFGVVYLVKNNETDILYALKKTNLNNFDSYINEINILKKFDHINIVKFHENYKKNNYYNILLEYIDGGTLESKINLKIKHYKKFNNDEIKKYITQLSDGLKYIHSFKIIHRDVKPSNLLLTKQNILKISDFGVSREYNTMENIKTFIGTPYYLAPEMVCGYKYNNKVDYWALGCILYELVSLKRPFDGKSIYSLVNKISNGRYNIRIIPFKYQKIIKNLLHLNSIYRYDFKQIDEFFTPVKLPLINVPSKNIPQRFNKKNDITILELYNKYNKYNNNNNNKYNKDSFYNLGFHRY